MSPVIDTENAMRAMAEAPARRTRADQGIPLAGGGTLTSTNVQDAIDQLAANAGGGGIADAPSDGTLYGRQNAAWTAVPPSGLADAPSDGTAYGRVNAAWANVLPLTGGILTGTLTLNADPVSALQAATKQYVDAHAANGVIPENSKSANYTTVLSDAGQFIYHPASDANARTFTIAANASVAYTLGTVISFVNMSANALTIAIATDTMYLAGPGTTGSRTLAQYGCATALKTDTAAWIISGTNLT